MHLQNKAVYALQASKMMKSSNKASTKAAVKPEGAVTREVKGTGAPPCSVVVSKPLRISSSEDRKSVV